jgi:hypothetical protein
MENNMVREEYWDEIEYNFFKDLDDEDKLLYLYDLMIGDFKDEYYGEDEIEFNFEDGDEEIRYEVLAIFDKAGYVSITGVSEELLRKVANDMVMNGLILSDRTLSKMEDGEYLLQYKVVGNTSPISLN